MEKRKGFEKTIILIGDLAGILASAVIAYALRYHQLLGMEETGDQVWQIIALCLFYLLVNVFVNLNKHFFRRGYFEEFVQVLKGQLIFAALWLSTLFVLHRSSGFSRLIFGYFFCMNLIFLYLIRFLIKRYLTRVYKKGKRSNRMLLITTSEKVENILDNLILYNDWNRILIGIVLIDKSEIGKNIRGYPVVSDRDGILDYVVHSNIDEAFIHLPRKYQNKDMQTGIAFMEMMGIIVDVNIDLFDFQIDAQKKLDKVGLYNVVTFARNIFSFQDLAAKRTLDIIGSLVGMVILGMVTLVLAPLIRLESPGKVFFGQTRVGKNGRHFTFYKFRSMYQDAEARKKELMINNEMNGFMFKMEHDPRVTKIGNFIRRTSLDELPQFWNVLKGDMSLVGTRPPTVDEYEKYEATHKCRLSMTPGITGLWQISGRSDIKDFEEVVKLDMEYIDHWSLKEDIKILILTLKAVFTKSGAK